MKKLIKIVLFVSMLAVQSQSSFAQDDVDRSVVEIAKDVYRLQNNNHFSMVVITSEGAVVVDPINADAASWIKSEVANLTDKPITHLIYSHSHGDHASGGTVLAQDAEVIVQANAPDEIDGVIADTRFAYEYEFSAGDKSFELTWLGPGHGTDLIAVVVRPANVGFITDAVTPKRLPWRDFGGANVDDMIAQIEKIESLDFETLIPAHGYVGVKSDAADVRVYLEVLKTEVLTGLKDGQSVDELKESILMSDYKDWLGYENWLQLNVEGMVNFLTSSGQFNPE